MWFAHSRDYRVFRRELEGDTTLVFSLPAVAADVTAEDRQAVRERFSSRPEAAAGYLESLASTKPVVRGLFTDDAGHVYVVPELVDVPAGTALDVFRDTGEYLGRLELPVAMHVPASGPLAAATRDHLYYLVADELDVPRLTRLRIVRPGVSAPTVHAQSAGETRVVLESDGWQLVGDLILPPGAGPAPAVLMLNKADGNRTAYEGLARLLAERGIASLRIDLRAHGESTNLGRFVPGDATWLAGSERDVTVAHEFLREHAAIDGDRIGVVGGSYSGESMAVAGRNHRYAQAYVALSPGSFSDQSLAAIDPSGVPWLFVTSREDRFLQGFELEVDSASSTAEMVVLSGAGHASDLLTMYPELPERVADWLAARLR
jgi:dienelactone hydrolase